MGIDGCCDHDTVSSNRWGGAVFFFITGFASLFAAVCTSVSADASIAFYNDAHEQRDGFALICGREGVCMQGLACLIVAELDKLGHGCFLADIPKFLDTRVETV